MGQKHDGQQRKPQERSKPSYTTASDEYPRYIGQKPYAMQNFDSEQSKGPLNSK